MTNPALNKNEVRALHVLGQTLAQIRALARSGGQSPEERLTTIGALADAMHNVPCTIADPQRYDAAEIGFAISAVAALHRKQGPAVIAASVAASSNLNDH